MFFHEPFGGTVPGAQGAVLGVLLKTGAAMTGRNIHALVQEQHSLWSVQQAIRRLATLGMIRTETVGRAGLHTVNEDHEAIGPLRSLLSPIEVLARIVRETVGDDVDAVILFGSVGRGESKDSSDVDLAVIAPPSWDRGIDLEDAVNTRLGNNCDVLHLTSEQFTAADAEPVVAHIAAEGIPLLGEMPYISSVGAA